MQGTEKGPSSSEGFIFIKQLQLFGTLSYVFKMQCHKEDM